MICQQLMSSWNCFSVHLLPHRSTFEAPPPYSSHCGFFRVSLLWLSKGSQGFVQEEYGLELAPAFRTTSLNLGALKSSCLGRLFLPDSSHLV